MQFGLRAATLDDRAAIRTVIERSARGLSAEYGSEQIEAALQAAFGVDSQLIADGTYFVAEAAGRIAGCGGWSRRRTLYGGDAHPKRDGSMLDPAHQAARIRAFFVDPDFARKGLGSFLLAHCEAKAAAAGFNRFELMATLPGVKLYENRGYFGNEMIELEVGRGITIKLMPMSKTL